MDFFQAQERARKATRRLVLWFALCVIAVVAVLYALAVLAKPFVVDEATATRWWDPEMLAIVAPTIGGIIILGSLFKLLQLSSGGAVVARDLGGRPVDPGTTDTLERRLLNVVEEMSIASGIAQPEVWILDHEDAINAFAAGTDPSNAVVGVTRGCLERLNRAELQGVIAHEFSHILNGDMKLNMRLIGWIFGLIMIAMLGRMLLEMLRFSRGSRDSKGNSGILVVVAAGIALWLVGSVGVLFARMLQASVSRQREYLADASAVQFTRDPTGLAGALRKIGGFWRNGALQTSKATEARHLFFAKSDFGLAALSFATHPPLEQRIKAIDPSWNGEMIKTEREETFVHESSPTREGRSVQPPPLPVFGLAAAAAAAAEPASREGIGSKSDAKALMFGLLLEPGDEAAAELLRERTNEALADRARAWRDQLAGETSWRKLAMVDVSLPWLRRMARDEAKDFIAVSRDLVAADGKLELGEFVVQKVIERHVAIGTGLRNPARIRHQSLAKLRHEVAVLIGAFAALSGDEASISQAAAEFREHTGEELPRLSLTNCSLEAVGEALDELDAATPLVKVRTLRMCGLVVSHDGVMEDRELELLRAAAEALGAPMPPLTAESA